MGLFDFLKPGKSQFRGFTDEGRQIGADTTKLRGELNHAKHDYEMALAKLEFEKRKLELENSIAELQEDAAEFEDDYPDAQGEDSADTMLIKLLAPMLLKNQQGGIPPPQAAPAQPSEGLPPGEPTDQELRDLWQKLPDQYKAQAKEAMKK